MDKELYVAAQKALENAHVPYSRFPVAAAIRMKDDTIITGVNVENASYGLANCAERTALFSAYSLGYRAKDIIEMVVTTPRDFIVSPCGACRQVIRELMPADATVHMADVKGRVKSLKNADLLPHAFTEDDL